MNSEILSVTGLDAYYGTHQALSDVSLSVPEGGCVAVVGANGAGKTTLLKTLIGAHQSAGGTVAFDGSPLGTLSPPKRVAHGMVLVPEGRQILVSLTVEENMLLGAGGRFSRSEINEGLQEIYERFPNLAERRHLEARVLSGGEQQMLAIGRALMARPRLMLLDEPSLGLSPALVLRVYDLLRSLLARGLSMLLVEQNVSMALNLAERGYVLELGRVSLSGPSAELLASNRLQEAYLGRSSASG